LNADGSPVAGPGDGAGAPGVDGVVGGAGGGAGAAGGPTGGTAATGRGAAGGAAAATGSTAHCVGNRQFDPAIDPAAPPCVPKWAGTDNGGATYQGVTAKEILIVDYYGKGNAGIDAILKAQQAYASIENRRDFGAAAADFLSTRTLRPYSS